MGKKRERTIEQVLWLAFQCAKQDRLTLCDAYEGMESEKAYKQAMADLADLERVQIYLFGVSKSKLQVALEQALPLPLSQIKIEEDDKNE